ncbi:MAG: tRNA (guanine(10)-N(2))-dimethyltransferase, partial [Candidatus Woesearchaeota archaeon]
MVVEGKIKLDIDAPGKVSKKLPVFYNSVMKLNRDISIEVLKRAFHSPARIALPLAGSGIRGLRFLAECGDKVNSLSMN